MSALAVQPLPGEEYVLARVGDRTISVPCGGRFRIAVDPVGPLRLLPLDTESARLLREERSAMGVPARTFDMTGLASKLGLKVKPPLQVVPDPEPEPERPGRATRPATAVEMIGQEAVRVQLMTRLQSAKIRGTHPGHILFYGPPGLGKTSLAEIVAQETGGTLLRTIASAVNTPRLLARELGKLTDGDVMFIDEIHGLPQAAEEMLYTAMEDFRIEVSSGQGEKQKAVSVDLAHFTLVGATTLAGRLSAPLRDRFAAMLSLEYYSDDELSRIVRRAAEGKDVAIGGAAADQLGARSRGTPRIALNLLDRVWDFAVTMAGSTDAVIDESAVDACLSLYGIDTLGLTPDDQVVLRAVCVDHQGGPVGMENLAATVGQDTQTLADAIEPYLIRAGLMQRTPRGRVATKRAFEHFELPVPIVAAWI